MAPRSRARRPAEKRPWPDASPSVGLDAAAVTRPLGWSGIGGGVLLLAGLGGLWLTLPRSDLLVNSGWVVGGSLAVGLLLGGLAGWLIGWTDLPGRRFWLALVFAWALTPLVVQLAAWDSLWGRLSWLSAMTQVNYTPWFKGIPAVIWVQGLACLPWIALWVVAARLTVSGGPEEEAQLVLPLAQVFARVSVPQHRVLGLLIALGVGLRVFEQIEVSDVYQVRTWPEVWYLGFALGQFEGWGSGQAFQSWWDFLLGTQLSEQAWGTRSAAAPSVAGPSFFRSAVLLSSLLASPLGLGMLLVTGLRRWVLVLPSWDWQPQRRLRVASPTLWQLYLAATILLPQAIIWSNLIVRAGLRLANENGHWNRYWSLAELIQRLGLAATDYRAPLIWSWLIGLVAALVVWSLALAATWRLSRPGLQPWGAGNFVLLAVAAASLATPAPLVSLGWYRLLNLSPWEWLNHAAQVSILGPVLALTYKQIGMGLLFWWVVFRQQPRAWREDMALQGIAHWRQFWHLAIRVPAGAHLLFLTLLTMLGAGDLSTVFATLPPGLDTFPRRLLGDLHAGASGPVAAACLLQIVMVVVVSWTSVRFWVHHSVTA